jgi:hypothetical protein
VVAAAGAPDAPAPEPEPAVVGESADKEASDA